MRASHRWGLVAAILVLLGVGLWLSLGRDVDEQAREDSTAAKTTTPLTKSTPRDDRRDSTATLLRSDKATLTGTVRNEQGQPIAGATVCAWPDQQKLRGASDGRPSCSKTEQDGHYRIEGLWPVSTGVSASAPEHIPARWSERVDGRLRYQLSLRAGQERSVDLTLEPGGVAVRGVVKDISGGVIEGALVNAATGWFGNSALAVAWTDDEGRFELWAEPGDLSLRARAEGYAEANTDSVAPTERAEIFLTPESVITGVVTHADTNAPVAGATVQARTSGFFGSGGSGAALTDEDGRFRISGLAPGIYELMAATDELFGESAEQIHLGLAEQAESNVRVHPAFAVRGRVVIAETGEPCSAGRVNLDGDDFDGYARIEDDGTILIQALLPGEYEVKPTCDGHMPEDKYEPLVITDASVDGVEWTVHTGLAIRGIVVDHRGDPVEKVNVHAQPKPKPGDDPRAQRTSQWGAETESDGSFALSGLLAGDYELGVWSQGYPPLPEPVAVELAEGTNVEDLRVVLPATGRLEGIVRDEAGEPVAGVTVETGLVDAWSNNRARTGDDGRFRFEHVQLGRHRVSAQIGWFDQMRAPGTTDDDVQGELVDVTEQATAEVELVVERRAGTIRGRVVDGDGAPIGDAFVDVSRMSDSAAAATAWSRMSMRWGWDRKPVLTDQDGAFELRELTDGKYIIRAYREGGGEALLEGVAVGTTDAVLTLVETGRIAGKVTLAGGGTPQRFAVSLRDRSAGLDRSDDFFRTGGAFSLRELPPGKYELTVTASEGSAQVTVELGSGQVVDDLAIELVSKVTVKGRLVDADTREPVPGMRVSVQERGGMFMLSTGDEPGDRRDVSDADGRFEVEDASTGKVLLSIMPRDFSDDGNYGWTQRSMTLAKEPAVQDIGEIELLASRVKDREKSGDTGFKTKPNEPNIEPEDAVFEVAVIRPGGPAEGTGLEVGDRIVEVDGRTVSGLDSHRYWQLMSAPPGTVIELTIEGGEKVKIELGPPLDW
ncbi:MAG TPA: carboxypeptidase regulatory-like domain-containing protein [Enhygromyxa sp.]|nr:carboxypeptidase regulatory-like domain-containing protein [Enhygromyxa sp.]